MESKPGDLDGLAESSGKAIKKETTVTTQESKVHAPTEDVPDPDEDDLDDLDDMLDEFAPTKTETKNPTVPASGPGRPQSLVQDPSPSKGISDEDFAKQLQAGMADLLGGLESSPEMQAQFESMLQGLGGAAGLEAAAAASGLSAEKPESKSSNSKDTQASVQEESFQETIKKTMERMKASGDQATAAATSENTDDILAEMMKAMQAGGLDGEGSDEDFSKMLLGMMEQLTNKEILYEPMKELHDKFPAWMEKNEKTVAKDDLKRYKEQQIYVKEIVGKFEEKTYKDENVADREYIVDRMQKMQAAGSPPADLVGDMAAAQEAFGAPEEGCPTQ